MEIHLNPADYEALQEQGITLLDEFDGVGHIEITPDESVPAGGCSVETNTVHVDARIDSQLAKILEALTE